MRIDLTDREIRTLINVLEDRLRELRHEIIHTSSNDFKIHLKDNERVLQCLHDKIVTMNALDVA